MLREDASEWFELDSDSPYMLIVADVREERLRTMTAEEQALFGTEKLNIVRSEIPAVTHVDYSARVQTVQANTNPLFHRLLTRFKEKTGCPVLVNTSFNVHGEPIVCTTTMPSVASWAMNLICWWLACVSYINPSKALA